MRDLGPKGSAMWGSGWFLRPAADRRLLPRTNNVRLTLGKTVIGSFATENDQVRLQLDDGTTRTVDSVVAGTGYRVNLDRLGFLSPDLLNTIKTRDGSPVLNRAMESSAARLYFTGAAAAAKFGPLTWFGGKIYLSILGNENARRLAL